MRFGPTWLIALGYLAAAERAWCFEDGAPPGHTGGFGEPDCSVCHSDRDRNPPEGRLAVDGWPSAGAAGKRYTLAVVLEHPELRSGGFQLAIRTPEGAPVGKLISISDRTRIVADGVQRYLQHSADGRRAEADGRIRWQFQWVAPEDAGTAILHVAANAANDDISALGDLVFTLEKAQGSAGRAAAD